MGLVAAGRAVTGPRQSARSAVITPRLLSKTQAAIYCGISVNTFDSVCTVRPVSLGKGTAMLRYDVVMLDKWIDGLAGGSPETGTDEYWMAKLAADGRSKRVRGGT